jgi:tRNA(fMet)-specific endonuclease VapC
MGIFGWSVIGGEAGLRSRAVAGRSVGPGSPVEHWRDNIVIALLEGDDTVLSNLDRAPEVFIPAVAVGALFFGAAKSGRPSENTARVERFAAGRSIIPCDLDVAREYGCLKQRLREKGRPLPENDIWIAATYIHHGMVLVTRDRHFQEVEDLEIEDWGGRP